MAKRTPVRARPRAGKSARRPKPVHAHLPAARRYSYTPALLASGRYRYEQTDEPVTAIAADFGCDKSTLARLAKRERWVRYVAPPRDLPPGARLLAQAEALERAAAGEPFPPRTARAGGGDACASPAAEHDPGGEMPPIAAIAARLHRAVLEQLAAVEALHAQLKRRPHNTLDVQRIASALKSLNATLHSLESRQAGAPQSGQDDDDFPADLDEFRNELARRIDAFVASRTEPGDADGGGHSAK